jgi:transcriptional regulator with XRE-family HTH domain
MDVDGLIGWNFRRLRLAQGLTQEELWLRLGTLDQSYLSQLEDGERNPTGRTIFRLAGALEVEVGELFSTKGVPDEILLSPMTTV